MHAQAMTTIIKLAILFSSSVKLIRTFFTATLFSLVLNSTDSIVFIIAWTILLANNICIWDPNLKRILYHQLTFTYLLFLISFFLFVAMAFVKLISNALLSFFFHSDIQMKALFLLTRSFSFHVILFFRSINPIVIVVIVSL